MSNYTITSGTLQMTQTDCCDGFIFSGTGPGVTTDGSFGFVEFGQSPFAVSRYLGDGVGFHFDLNSESGLNIEINGYQGDPSMGRATRVMARFPPGRRSSSPAQGSTP